MSEETAKLISLVKLTQSIEGRKRFQKVIFILQNEGIDFGKNFKYANFGPYSVDLQIELEALVHHNILIETESNGTYTYSYNEHNTYVPVEKINAEVSTRANLVEYLTKNPAQELELVSTIYFLKNKGREYSDNTVVKRKLEYLKPHLSSKIETAFKIYDEIRSGKFN